MSCHYGATDMLNSILRLLVKGSEKVQEVFSDGNFARTLFARLKHAFTVIFVANHFSTMSL